MPSSEEESRMARIREGMARYLSTLSTVGFIVASSTNENVLVYEYRENEEPNVRIEWLALEPEDQSALAAKGSKDFRAPMNVFQEAILGIDMWIGEGDRFLVKLKHPNLSDRTYDLVLDGSGSPAVVGPMIDESGNTVVVRLEYAYVQFTQSLLPTSEYVKLVGRRIDSGEWVTEFHR